MQPVVQEEHQPGSRVGRAYALVPRSLNARQRDLIIDAAKQSKIDHMESEQRSAQTKTMKVNASIAAQLPDPAALLGCRIERLRNSRSGGAQVRLTRCMT
jgi:hypothetical protein